MLCDKPSETLQTGEILPNWRNSRQQIEMIVCVSFRFVLFRFVSFCFVPFRFAKLNEATTAITTARRCCLHVVVSSCCLIVVMLLFGCCCSVVAVRLLLLGCCCCCSEQIWSARQTNTKTNIDRWWTPPLMGARFGVSLVSKNCTFVQQMMHGTHRRQLGPVTMTAASSDGSIKSQRPWTRLTWSRLIEPRLSTRLYWRFPLASVIGRCHWKLLQNDENCEFAK